MSLQLNFSDQLVLIDLSEYDEAALLSHVKACHSIVDQLPSHFDISRREEEGDSPRSQRASERISGRNSGRRVRNSERSSDRQESTKESTKESAKESAKESRQDNDSDTDSVMSRTPTCIQLSPAATDSVRSACLSSARLAVVQVVQRTRHSVQGLVDLFFVETHNSSWIGPTLMFRCWLR